MDVKRITGYYWIVFPYANQPPRWEPAGWDEQAKTWALVGSCDEWHEEQLLKIGAHITGAPND